MRSTLIFRGVPESEKNDCWEEVSQNLVGPVAATLNRLWKISIPRSQVSETPLFRKTWVEAALNYDIGLRNHNTPEVFNSM